MSAILHLCVLREADSFSDILSVSHGPLRPHLEFEELRLVPDVGDPNVTLVEVGLEFTFLGPDEADEDDANEVVDICALYRLLYRHPLPATSDDRDQVLERAARDAWPVFRSHVDRSLSEMGLPPFHGHRHMPIAIGLRWEEVFRSTSALDKKLAELAEERKAHGAD